MSAFSVLTKMVILNFFCLNTQGIETLPTVVVADTAQILNKISRENRVGMIKIGKKPVGKIPSVFWFFG